MWAGPAHACYLFSFLPPTKHTAGEASPDANKKKFSELRTMPGPHMAIAALNHNNEDNKAIEILEKHVATCKLETRQFDALIPAVLP